MCVKWVHFKTAYQKKWRWFLSAVLSLPTGFNTNNKAGNGLAYNSVLHFGSHISESTHYRIWVYKSQIL